MRAFDDFMTILKADDHLLDVLLSALTDETSALSKREFSKLESISLQKQEASAKLEHNYGARRAFLQQFGSQEKKESLDGFLHKLNASQQKAVRESNLSLEEKLAKCRHRNTVNGQVIAVNLSNHQSLHNLMHGKSTPSTYKPDGQMHNKQGSSKHQKI